MIDYVRVLFRCSRYHNYAQISISNLQEYEYPKRSRTVGLRPLTVGRWGRTGFLCFYLRTNKQTHSVGPFSNNM